MLTLYFHITHMEGSVLETEGQEYPDLYVATAEAMESLQELVATALLSRRQRIPLGIAICSEEGTILREVSVNAAVPETAQSHQASVSTPLGICASSGSNAVGESNGPGRPGASLIPRPFDAVVRPTPSVEN
ncbi:DUF6894 family protein [Rhizobium leguminosarum]|uniref:DUF6894 family protein n=1 Tax=Rhizobium leguminosarum TaxID=384 RepID=UPI000FEC7F65|nr:hypothetical protein [Rhizobium leguminosarum]RWX38964.1 hypothetical protein EHI43_03185 [Rhizobium leguminosarum]